MRKINLVGKSFGRLTVTEPAPNKNKRVAWLCKCECGNTKTILAGLLMVGHTKSCGCLHKEIATNNIRKQHGSGVDNPNYKHGARAAKHAEYNIWKSMNQRCNNPNYDRFKDYGGRGITVCSEWTNSYESFIADMGPRPSPKYSVERIDNNKGYSPDNCKWATQHEQMANTRRNVFLTHEDETLHIAEWARRLNVNAGLLQHRYHLGWSVEDILFKPLRNL